MNNIKNFRDQIDAIDNKLLSLLIKRMDIAKQVGLIKEKLHLQVEDNQREQDIIKRLATLSDDPLTRTHIKKIFSEVFKAAKDIQIPQK